MLCISRFLAGDLPGDSKCVTRPDGFWPGLGLPKPKAIVVIPNKSTLAKTFTKKTSKSAKHACHYATKKDPLK